MSRAQAHGPLEHISLNSFCPASLRLHGAGYSHDAVLQFTRTVLERGNRLGFRYLGIGAPASRNLLPGEDPVRAMEEFRQVIGDICALAAQYGMEILMESVRSVECNFITTTRQALRFVREMRGKNLHLVYDIYHEFMERQPVSVIDEAADEIRVVHAAQNAKQKRAYLFPDQSEVFCPYWQALQKVGYGYRGRLRTPEAFNKPENTDLRENMGAAAHLIHGSSDGRFSIAYAVKDITCEEIESVGFRSASYDKLAKKFDPEKLHYGCNTVDGEEIYYIPNPALGRWINREKF